MKRIKLLFPLVLVMVSFSFAGAVEKEHVHKFITGTVEKISANVITVKTDKGTTRTISVKEAEKEGITGLKQGDRLFLEIEEGNQIVDIDRVTAEGVLEHAEEHQSVVGELVRYDKANKQVMIRVNSGKSKTYTMKDAAATKMNSVNAGTKVKLELDEESNLVNDFLIGEE